MLELQKSSDDDDDDNDRDDDDDDVHLSGFIIGTQATLTRLEPIGQADGTSAFTLVIVVMIIMTIMIR